MKCPNHLTRDVAGYCCVCGSFFCQDCFTRHEGNLYCKKHYKPVAQELEREQRLTEGRKRRSRHALVVHFRNGQEAQGACRTMNLRDFGFHLECENDDGVATGETLRVRFEDIKYVCHVKSYDGEFEPGENTQDYTPGGTDIVAEFEDGEVIEGKTMNLYNPDHPRFYLIPKDMLSNNINVLIESSALSRVYTPEQYEEMGRLQEQLPPGDDADGGGKKTPVQLEQDESMGDFYFEQRNYQPAMEQYALASQKHPDSVRIRRKLVVATINVGIGFIKSRDYPDALKYMERALEIDPGNPHAEKKAKQLQKVIEKTQRRMKAYLEGNLVPEEKKRDQR